MPLRILHLSDLHERAAFQGMPASRIPTLKRDTAARGLVFDEGFYHCLREIASNGVDLVCFTGDVADWGRPEEYAEATKRIQKILRTVAVKPDQFFVVPGNHDVQRTLHEDAWKGLREWCRTGGDVSRLGSWLVWGDVRPTGIEPGWADILRRKQCFWQWTKDLGCPDIQPSESSPLGYRYTFAAGTWPHINVPVHIIGLDSAWLCGDDNDQGKILVTEEQVLAHVRNGADALDGFRLALVHHPISELADQHGVWGLLAEGVDLVLHGHQHRPLVSNVSVPGARLRTLAAGCLIEGDLGKGWPNGFQFVEVDVETGDHRVHFRKWARDAAPKFWAKGSDIYPPVPGAPPEEPKPPRVGRVGDNPIDSKDAAQLLRYAIDIAEQDDEQKAQDCLNLGLVFLERDLLSDARVWLKRAEDLATRLDIKELLRRVYRYRAIVALRLGSVAEAQVWRSFEREMKF